MKICYTNRGLLMLTREEIQMSEQQFTDFFDPEIQKIVSEDGCSIYRMKNVTGEGVITRYEILPGIELFYNDFHMSDSHNSRIKILIWTILLCVSIVIHYRTG